MRNKQCNFDPLLFYSVNKNGEHTSSPAIFAFFTTLLVIMDYVRSNKGGTKLLFQNNLYVKQKVLSSGAVCWECDQRRNKFACKAKLHVLDDQVIKQVNDHTHVASRAVVESSKVRQEMKSVQEKLKKFDPLFDLAFWNMYDQTIGDLPRTNNVLEDWHRRFQANVGAYHPNVWKFIDILKRERSLNHVNISQVRADHQPEPQRRRYQDSNRRIKNIVQDYHNRDRLQYLRGLAHNISL